MNQSKSISPVIFVRTDRGTEFLNNTLNAFFKEEVIEHQTSTPRTPEHNSIVERRNCTLIEAARTMLLASKLPLFFWAEAILHTAANTTKQRLQTHPILHRCRSSGYVDTRKSLWRTQFLGEKTVMSGFKEARRYKQLSSVRQNSMAYLQVVSTIQYLSKRIVHKLLTRVLRIILVIVPEHPSDTYVLTMKMEILLEPASNKLLVADLGASINLLPYSLYAKLSLETLKPTKISVRLADRSFQYPVGIAKNMLFEVGKFTFPADFVILKMEEDSKVPLILGRSFLHTADAVIRVKQKQLNLGVGIE
ncbi:reverse transcriptase domain-containing protein [Tanacetum coccineum]